MCAALLLVGARFGGFRESRFRCTGVRFLYIVDWLLMPLGAVFLYFSAPDVWLSFDCVFDRVRTEHGVSIGSKTEPNIFPKCVIARLTRLRFLHHGRLLLHVCDVWPDILHSSSSLCAFRCIFKLMFFSFAGLAPSRRTWSGLDCL